MQSALALSVSPPPVPAPTHHPAAELLLDYASGATSEAESLMIAIHLGACRECRRAFQTSVAVGGALLDAIAPVRIAPALLNRTLSAIDTMPADRPVKPKPQASGGPTESCAPFWRHWPAPLRAYLDDGHVKKWRWLPAGFRALRVPCGDPSARIWLMKAPGGRGPFPHSHTHDEWTVVLEGGFTDETGTYAAGDFACAGPGDAHTVVAEPGEGCVCVLLVRAPPVYTCLPGRLLAPFIQL